MIAILDNIRSVHNVGSIFRTSDGAGIAKLYLCGVTPEPTDRFGKIRDDFRKTALGAEENVKWKYFASTAKCIARLKKEGWNIIMLEQSPKSVMYNSLKFTKNLREKTAIVVGREVEGISKSILKYADTIIEIPMRGAKESLNVSVAFGIAVYALNK